MGFTDKNEREEAMATKRISTSMRGKRSVAGWTLLLLAVALIATGCSALASETPAPLEEERESFSARRESEDGAIVFWSGYVEGYEPGAEAAFDVSIKNEMDQAWSGRYCLQLMGNDEPMVLNTLEQRPFELEPGVGFSDTITVEFPAGVGDGAYHLSMVVRKPGHPTVDMVPIQIGETEEAWKMTTQRDMDAALEACPPVSEPRGEADLVVELAQEDLAQLLDVAADEIEVESVRPVDFPDASLGVPETDKAYAQVITPGYVIRLAAGGETYAYHAADGRVVLAVEGAGSADGE
jgi:hypothetical protein